MEKKRLKNAYLVLPVASIEADKGIILHGIEVDPQDFDTQYIAISIIDFLAERLAIGQGASGDEINDYVIDRIESLYSKYEEKVLRDVITKILDRLANGPNGFKSFEYAYYDEELGRLVPYQFKLIEWWQPDIGESFIYKATPESVTLFLSMFTIDPVLEHATQSFVIKQLLSQGLVSGAVQFAQKASDTSRAIGAELQNYMLKLRRNPRRKGWVEEVLPKLEEARKHIHKHTEDDQELQDKLQEMLQAESLEPEQQKNLLELKKHVDKCYERHLDLFAQIGGAINKCYEYQSYAFKTPKFTIQVSPEEDLIPRFFDMPLGEVIKMAEKIGCMFLSPSPPQILDIFKLLELYEEYHGREVGTAKQPKPQKIKVSPPPLPEYDPNREAHISEMIVNSVFEGDCSSTMGLLLEMDEGEEKYEYEDYQCAMHVLRTIYRGKESQHPISSKADGEFKHQYAVGTNLELSPNSESKK